MAHLLRSRWAREPRKRSKRLFVEQVGRYWSAGLFWDRYAAGKLGQVWSVSASQSVWERPRPAFLGQPSTMRMHRVARVKNDDS